MDTDGDLDVVRRAGGRGGAACVLRNNGDGTFAAITPFSSARARARVRVGGPRWRRRARRGVSASRWLRAAVHQPARRRVSRADAASDARQGRGDRGGRGHGRRADGPDRRSRRRRARQRVARDGDDGIGSARRERAMARHANRARRVAAEGLAPGARSPDRRGSRQQRRARSHPRRLPSSRVMLGGPKQTFTALDASIPIAAFDAADMDDDGRLELRRSSRAGADREDREEPRHEGVSLDAIDAEGGDRDRRSAHQFVRHRRRSGSADWTARAEADHHVARSCTSALARRRRRTSFASSGRTAILQSEFEKRADTTVKADQRLKGSCPWLFAWNGREMAFVTDLIWRSPLGLRINAQATADVLMTEDWVKVRGDQLRARDGRVRPARHRRSVGDAFLRPRVADGRRPS